jgi:hypothetical protein
MAVNKCCVATALTAHGSFNVGDGSPSDLLYAACLANPGAYSNQGVNCGQVTTPGGYAPALPSLPGSTGSGGSKPVSDTCPPFSLTDPGPALQCFAFTVLRYLFVNLAAAAVFAYGLKLAFNTEFQQLAANVREGVGKLKEVPEATA